MNTQPLPAIMTIVEAAAVCRCHHSTLRRAIARGDLVVSRPGGRDIRITADQLQAWLASTSTSKTASA